MRQNPVFPVVGLALAALIGGIANLYHLQLIKAEASAIYRCAHDAARPSLPPGYTLMLPPSRETECAAWNLRAAAERRPLNAAEVEVIDVSDRQVLAQRVITAAWYLAGISALFWVAFAVMRRMRAPQSAPIGKPSSR